MWPFMTKGLKKWGKPGNSQGFHLLREEEGVPNCQLSHFLLHGSACTMYVDVHVLVRWVLLSFSFCGLARRHYRRCTHFWVDGQNKGENGKEEEWQARLPINSS